MIGKIMGAQRTRTRRVGHHRKGGITVRVYSKLCVPEALAPMKERLRLPVAAVEGTLTWTSAEAPGRIWVELKRTVTPAGATTLRLAGWLAAPSDAMAMVKVAVLPATIVAEVAEGTSEKLGPSGIGDVRFQFSARTVASTDPRPVARL